jgi:hypothetical protein
VTAWKPLPGAITVGHAVGGVPKPLLITTGTPVPPLRHARSAVPSAAFTVELFIMGLLDGLGTGRGPNVHR